MTNKCLYGTTSLETSRSLPHGNSFIFSSFTVPFFIERKNCIYDKLIKRRPVSLMYDVSHCYMRRPVRSKSQRMNEFFVQLS